MAPIPRLLHLRQRVLAVVANALELSALDDRLGAIADFEIAAAQAMAAMRVVTMRFVMTLLPLVCLVASL